MSDSTCLYAITNQQVLTFTGPDSSKFMQGQFSCNLDEVTHIQYRRGACCNAKGRMVASFNLAHFHDDFLMALDASLAETLQAHLKKYMVFFKSEIQLNPYTLVGIKGPDAAAILQSTFAGCPSGDFNQHTLEHGIIIKLPFDAGYEVWLEQDGADEHIQALKSKCTLPTKDTWNHNLIQGGLAQLTLENHESFIPQMINLGPTGGISFNKGCYTGQEIVARMQYLGKLKRHCYQIKIPSDQVNSGDDLYVTDTASSCGTIINHASNGDFSIALAVIEDKHLDSPIFVGSEQGPAVELLSLPYDPLDTSS